MNLAACAGAVACTALVAAAASGSTSSTGTDAGIVGDVSTLNAPATLSSSTDPAAAAAAVLCGSSSTAPSCNVIAPDAPTDKVFYLPAPTGDQAKDFATLMAAIKDTRYDTIDGASNGQRLSYTINGMLEINRSLTIRNLELHQTNTSYVVRTIYAAGGGTPITLKLENIKIERGPANSYATGSVSDSAGIWTTNVTPQFSNIEVYGGGKGEGLEIVNATGGYLNDVYVHDITWQPYLADQNDPTFWPTFTLATLKAQNNWNYFQILDYNGQALARTRIEEQANGIILNGDTNLTVLRPRISKIQVMFSDGQLYPYQSDGITVVAGNGIAIQNGIIDHVAEGIDMPGFPNEAIDVSGTSISDAPLFCFKTRGSYDNRNFSIAADSTNVVTVRGSTGSRCGIAAFYSAAGATAWFENTTAVDTGLGPDGSAAPGIGSVAAYRFENSSTLPTLDPASAPIGMHILNATVSNPNSTVMQSVFNSENNPNDPRTYAMVQAYTVSNPSAPKVTLSANFTSVKNTAVAQSAILIASAPLPPDTTTTTAPTTVATN